MVRRATLDDVPNIVRYLMTYHKDSNMKDIEFDRLSVVKMMEYYIQAKDSVVFVSERDGGLRGVLAGSLEPYFFNQKKYYATDLVFIADRDGQVLWQWFRDWAFEMGADRLIMAVSSGIERADRLLQALGMETTGGMYEFRQESS